MNNFKGLMIGERRKASILRALTISVALFGHTFLLKSYGLTLLDATTITGYAGLMVYALVVWGVITPPASYKSVEEFATRIESILRDSQLNVESKTPDRAAKILASEIGYHGGGFTDERAKAAMMQVLMKHIKQID